MRGCLHTKHENLFFMDKAHQHEIKDELRSGAIGEANADAQEYSCNLLGKVLY